MARTRVAHRARQDTRGPMSMTSTLWRGGKHPRTSAVIWTALFTAVQAWALLTVLTLVHPHGVAFVALACAMVGVVMAVILAWASCGRRHRCTARYLDDQMDQPEPQYRDRVPLRGRVKR
jgi:hypothetical protein